VSPPLVPSDAVSRPKGGLWTVGNPVRINFEFLRELHQEFTTRQRSHSDFGFERRRMFYLSDRYLPLRFNVLPDTLSWQIFRTYNRLFIFSAPSLSYRFAII
jgi:hypothetical protein